jgi:hypothetical protein
MKVEFIKDCSFCHHAKWVDPDGYYYCSNDRYGRGVRMKVNGVRNNEPPEWCKLKDLDEIRKEEYVQAYLDAWNIPPDDLDEISEISERARELWKERNKEEVKNENL